VRVGGLKLKPDGEVLQGHLGIIRRLGLLAKSSFASKLASGCRVFRRILKYRRPGVN
jgi:hypothetical protein